ncbi:MAG: DUF47 family protein [Desulfovibrio sp.]|nr:DUF47 family protein [Desulfovibrio sp.]
MFNVLMPKGAPFFEMLLEQNALLLGMMQSLVNFLTHTPHEHEQHHKVNTDLEERGDVLYGKILRALSQTFITPIDREDILRISQKQEETMDCLHGLSLRLSIFDFEHVRFPAKQLAKTIQQMLKLTTKMLEGLAKKQDSHKTRAFRALRDEGDSLLAVGLAELMDTKDDFTSAQFLLILKWNQAYERLSMVLEATVSLGETIEEAVLKNV